MYSAVPLYCKFAGIYMRPKIFKFSPAPRYTYLVVGSLICFE